MGHTSLCVFTVDFWFSDYAIFSEEVRLLNQGKKESFGNVNAGIYEISRREVTSLLSVCHRMTLLLLEIFTHTEGTKEISQQFAKNFSLITERTF